MSLNQQVFYREKTEDEKNLLKILKIKGNQTNQSSLDLEAEDECSQTSSNNSCCSPSKTDDKNSVKYPNLTPSNKMLFELLNDTPSSNKNKTECHRKNSTEKQQLILDLFKTNEEQQNKLNNMNVEEGKNPSKLVIQTMKASNAFTDSPLISSGPLTQQESSESLLKLLKIEKPKSPLQQKSEILLSMLNNKIAKNDSMNENLNLKVSSSLQNVLKSPMEIQPQPQSPQPQPQPQQKVYSNDDKSKLILSMLNSKPIQSPISATKKLPSQSTDILLNSLNQSPLQPNMTSSTTTMESVKPPSSTILLSMLNEKPIKMKEPKIPAPATSAIPTVTPTENKKDKTTMNSPPSKPRKNSTILANQSITSLLLSASKNNKFANKATNDNGNLLSALNGSNPENGINSTVCSNCCSELPAQPQPSIAYNPNPLHSTNTLINQTQYNSNQSPTFTEISMDSQMSSSLFHYNTEILMNRKKMLTEESKRMMDMLRNPTATSTTSVTSTATPNINSTMDNFNLNSSINDPSLATIGNTAKPISTTTNVNTLNTNNLASPTSLKLKSPQGNNLPSQSSLSLLSLLSSKSSLTNQSNPSHSGHSINQDSLSAKPFSATTYNIPNTSVNYGNTSFSIPNSAENKNSMDLKFNVKLDIDKIMDCFKV